MIAIYLLGFLVVFGLLVWYLFIYSATEDSSAAAPLLAIDGLLSGNSERSVEEMRRWYENSGQDVMVGLALGNVLRHSGKLDTALRTHKSLALRTDLNPLQQRLVNTELSADYLALNQMDEAESAFEQALDAGDPDQRTVLLGERIYSKTRKWEKAVKLVQGYGKKSGEDVKARLGLLYYAQGRELWDAEALAEANKLFKKATGTDPNCKPAWLAMARYHRYSGKPEKALKLLEKRTDVFVNQPWLRMEALTKVALAMENHDVFLEPARAHLEDNPDDWRTRATLAAFLNETGVYKDAAAELLTCLEAKPGALLLHREYLKLLYRCDRDKMAPRLLTYQQQIEADHAMDHVWACGSCGHTSDNFMWVCPACRQIETCDARRI